MKVELFSFTCDMEFTCKEQENYVIHNNCKWLMT